MTSAVKNTIMPSKTASKLLGEAKPPKPSDIFQQSYPSNGKGQLAQWRLHRVLGVAPTNPPDYYEEWLEDLALSNVDSEHATNEVSADQLAELAKADDEAMRAFLTEVIQLARHTGADTVAFTVSEGLA